MNKMSYSEFSAKMYEHNSKVKDPYKEAVGGVIVFTEDSFNKVYPLESRSYEVSSNNKAWIAGMGGYSIYGTSLDRSDVGVSLETYMREEKGGKDGWKVDYCYMIENESEVE